jgi:hypothetical protein
MQTTFSLLRDIKSELERAFRNMPFRDSGQAEAYRIPGILIGHIPPKVSLPASAGIEQTMAAADPPFILIRELDGELKEDEKQALIHEVRIGVLCCVFSNESYKDVQAGYNDISTMKDTVLLTLNGREYWADNYWRRVIPVKWIAGLDKAVDVYTAGSQFHPYYGAAITGTFYTGAMNPPRNPKVDVEAKD